MNRTSAEDLKRAIDEAVSLHGHLGPFLVVGVRMGNLAMKVLRCEKGNMAKLRARVKVPLVVPFSCTLDGIQVTTHCTVGNQRLACEESEEEMRAVFTVEGSRQTLSVSVNPSVVKDLRKRMTSGSTNEELAMLVSQESDERLFRFNER